MEENRVLTILRENWNYVKAKAPDKAKPFKQKRPECLRSGFRSFCICCCGPFFPDFRLFRPYTKSRLHDRINIA